MEIIFQNSCSLAVQYAFFWDEKQMGWTEAELVGFVNEAWGGRSGLTLSSSFFLS